VAWPADRVRRAGRRQPLPNEVDLAAQLEVSRACREAVKAWRPGLVSAPRLGTRVLRGRDGICWTPESSTGTAGPAYRTFLSHLLELRLVVELGWPSRSRTGDRGGAATLEEAYARHG